MKALAVWLLIKFAAAALGALATMEAKTFYQQLERPGWAPHGAVFGPVWTILYILMGFAAWLVWREQTRLRGPRVLYLLQLVCNALWSWLFFAWRLGSLAFVEVTVLLLLIAATVAAFWRVRQLAAVLLLPYLGWVTFATALTWNIWQANPALL